MVTDAIECQHELASQHGLLVLIGTCTKCGQHVADTPLLTALQSAVQKNIQKQGEDIPELSGDGWSGVMTCWACPVQIEGKVDGKEFYFRARWGEWRMSIADTLDAAIDGDGFGAEGDAPDGDEFGGSWMAHADAWERVAATISSWREAGRP